MTEPTRWLHSSSAPLGVRELLSEAQKTRAMSPVDKQRGARQLGQVAAIPLLVVGLWTKLAAGALLVGATGSVWLVPHLLAQRSESRAALPPSSVGARASTSAVPSVSVQPATPDAGAAEAYGGEAVAGNDSHPKARTLVRPIRESVEPQEEAVLTPPERSPREQVATESLRKELDLLERAQALLAGDPAACLEVLDAHAKSFPHGRLAQEREMLRLRALKRIGRNEEVRQRAKVMLEQSPKGVFSDRLEDLAGESAPDSGR